MGYDMSFKGKFKIEPTLTMGHFTELKVFVNQRHDRPEFPGTYCQWESTDGEYLQWNGGEKFYNYVEWIEYLVEKFFQPRGYVLNGMVEYQGESIDNAGIILINKNIVRHRTNNDVVNELDKYMEIVQKLAMSDLDDKGYCSSYKYVADLIKEAKFLTKTE